MFGPRGARPSEKYRGFCILHSPLCILHSKDQSLLTSTATWLQPQGIGCSYAGYHAEVVVIGQHNCANPLRAASNHNIGQRQHGSRTVQIPQCLLGLFPESVVGWHIQHQVPESAKVLAYFHRPQRATDFAPNNSANGQISLGRGQGQGTQRISPVSQVPNIKATVCEERACGHRSRDVPGCAGPEDRNWDLPHP